MQAISVFMFAVAISLGITTVVSFFIKNENSSIFFTPAKSDFNIAWGLLFFVLYGILTIKDDIILYLFYVAAIINFIYILYLYLLKNFIKKERFLFSILMGKLIDFEIDRQILLDKKFGETYSKEKAIKVLGITPYELKLENIKSLVEDKFGELNLLLEKNKISNKYFNNIIKNSYEALVK